MFKDQKDKIKEALLKGNGQIVIAERGSGKTHALFEILLEKEDIAIVVHTDACRQRYIDFFEDKFPGVYTRFDINNIIFYDQFAESKLKGTNRKVYIDEYFMCKYYKGPFEAAVGTLPHGTIIIS